MKYVKSEKYKTPELQSKIMGPNPVKLEEELPIKFPMVRLSATSGAVRV